MSTPTTIVFERVHPKQLDLDRPEGCDHDRNVYCFRLVDGVMVFRGVALGPRWENREMNWQGLSCYKRKEDEQMALITKESGKPEARKDKDEIMAKAKVLIAGGLKITEAARELNVPAGTLHTWMGKEKKRAEKAKELLDSVDAGKPVRSMGCIEPELSDKATEVVTAPIGVEVPDPDDMPIPYVVGPDPLDVQIDVMLDCLWDEKRAKLKAHLKPLLSDPETWDIIVRRGLA